MTIERRESFLDNLAANLGRERRTSNVEKPEWKVQPQHRVLQGATQEELVHVLEKQCKEIHTDFVRTNQTRLLQVLEETMRKYKATSIVSAGGERISKFGLDAIYNRLENAGMEVHIWHEDHGEKNKVFAEQADVGITFSDITLAESGTVTLFNDINNGRSISLLPRAYVAIIPKSTLVKRMTQATKHIHQEHVKGHSVSSCVSFVTGPSNSADIEMKLIVGVHGPVAATYIVID